MQLESEVSKELAKEAVAMLSEYIQIDTSVKGKGADAGYDFLVDILEREEIEYITITSDTYKKSILAHISGDGTYDRSLVLLNHMDVVPANKDEWEFEPYGGNIIDNYITGRGSIDMKSMGIAELMSLIYLKRNKLRLKRDIYFLAVPDEELGGKEGTKYVVEHYLDKIRPQVVLDEGGWGTCRLNNKGAVFFAACGQKKGVFLKVKVKGQAGHAALPHKSNANDILIKALNDIRKSKYPVCKEEEIWKSVQRMMKQKSFLGYILSLSYKVPGIAELIANRFQKDKFLNAILRNTITITVIQSGKENNVIPATAEAILDCRIMPKGKTEDIINWVKKTVRNDKVEIEIVKELTESNTSPYQTKFMMVAEEVIKANYESGILLPYITPLGTDAKYFREYGIEGVGLFPGILEEEDLNTMHGVNEKLRVDVFNKACKTLIEIVLNYCL